jgi:hypothetical protein
MNKQNPTPKERLMEIPNAIAKHRDLVSSNEFIRGADFTMLQYGMILSNQTTNTDSAVVSGLKMQGAIEFLTVFRMIAEPIQMPKPTVMEGLDHNLR